MKLTYFVESITGVEYFEGRRYTAADGVLFDGDCIDLEFYLKGYHEVHFFGNGLIKTIELMRKKPEKKVFHIKNFSLFESPLLMEGEVEFISHLDDSICKLTKSSDSGGYENVYISLITGKRVTPRETGSLHYVDHEYIMVERSNVLYCSDWSGEVLWKKDFESFQGRYHPNNLFKLIGGGVLINWGALSDDTGLISLIDRRSGNVIWEQKFSARVENSYFINNKIYLCVGNKMMIMNVEGEVEKEFIADVQEQQLLSLWTDEKLLYLFATIPNQILVYAMNGDFIRRYDLPEHPVLWHGSKIYSIEGINYLCLYRANDYFVGVESGLLTWAAEDILAGKELELEERPLIVIVTVKEDDGSQSYYLNVPSIDIHELLRHTEIEVRRLLSMRAKPYYFENKETRNKKFNGQIKLLIDAEIGESNRPYLDMLVKRCNYFASSSFMKSGNGKKDIEISWVFSDQL